MINSISLKNFRSYKDTFIEFHPNVNVIIGENDSGKTNLLRAINLVINNRPTGDGYISDWGGDVDVGLSINGKKISRFRNVKWDKKLKKFKAGTINQYILAKDNPLNAVGSSVPEIIKQYLNMSSVNIAFQLEGPFLLGMSPPDVAKHYNNAVNLDIIDRAISNIASTLRKERASLQVEKETERKKNEELKEYDWLSGAEESVIKLERLQLSINKVRNDWSMLASLINKLEELGKAVQSLEQITKFETALLSLIDKAEKINHLKNDYEKLVLLTQELGSLIATNEELNQIVQHQNEVNLLIEKSKQVKEDTKTKDELENYIVNLKYCLKAEKQYKNIVKYANSTKALLVLDGEIEKSISEYNTLQELLSEQQSLNQKYKDVGIELKNLEVKFSELMPNICPLCEQEIK